MKPIAVFGFLVIAGVVSAAEIAPTRDGARILVNKDVNGERWAITYDKGRQSVTGNVLLPNGGATFIDCDARPQGTSSIGMTCYSWAETFWQFLTNVSLPNSFFGVSDNPGGTCSGVPVLVYISYGDNCGVRAQADLDFEQGHSECSPVGNTYDATDLAIDGARVSLEADGNDNFTARIEYRGACSGVATGTGRFTDIRNGSWRADGTLTGSTSCCPNLSATFSIFQ